MIKRIIFGSIGVLYLILMFTIGGWFFNLSVFAFAVIGMYEFFNAFKNIGYKPLVLLAYIIIAVYYASFLCFEPAYTFSILIISIISIVAVPVFIHKINVMDTSVTLLGLFYPGVIFLFMILLYNLEPPYKHYLLIVALISNFSTDTFAYFVGMSLGKHKLCPRISPNKTIEGSLGGLVGSIVMSTLTGLFFNKMYNMDINTIHYLIIGLIIGVISQTGDLSASKIKRYCNIKDFGSLIPGHGGILDRFDSLLFTLPIIYIYQLVFLAQ